MIRTVGMALLVAIGGWIIGDDRTLAQSSQPATFSAPAAAAAQVIPRPVRLETLPGAFVITDSTRIVVDAGGDEVRAVADSLAYSLGRATGHNPGIVEGGAGAPAKGAVHLVLARGAEALGDEGYELTVTTDTVMLRAPKVAGLFWGAQTIRQLVGPEAGSAAPSKREIPCVRITDSPRYAWRGLLLDCCRHFMTKDFVKRYIDLLAYHKMNVLHWHLTEDQGWRIAIRKYPRLTEVGAWRDDGGERYGGFYSQEDIREVVAYAASRHITVVPEIEMPGHCTAALAAYPELSCTGGPFPVETKWGVFKDVYCAGNDRTFEFLEDVLSEVMELFPSTYIHIGGDEVPKNRWHECPKCQARIKAEGLKDEHELQSYFVRRVEKFLNGRGRRLIGWDEILEGGVAPNATVQSWRGMAGAVAAATAGHDVISSPHSHTYVIYDYNAISLEKIYSFEPTPKELTADQAKHVLGAEAAMWTEYAWQDRVDHQVFPRLCAMAEVAWSPAEARDWADFSRRMSDHYRRLDAMGVTYYIPPPTADPPDTTFAESIEVKLVDSTGRGVIRYTLDGAGPTRESQRYTAPIPLKNTTTISARTFWQGGNASDIVQFKYRKP